MTVASKVQPEGTDGRKGLDLPAQDLPVKTAGMKTSPWFIFAPSACLLSAHSVVLTQRCVVDGKRAEPAVCSRGGTEKHPTQARHPPESHFLLAGGF